MGNFQHPEVAWLTEARKHIGLKEIKGEKHHPEKREEIIGLAHKLRDWGQS